MHELFPNWMSKVGPQIDSARLAARWNAAKKVADDATVPVIAKLSEQALGLGSAGTETLRAAAREADTTYVFEDDALELSILAAGALAQLMQSGAKKGDAAAVSIRTGVFGRSDIKGMARDLHRLADGAVQRISEENRKETIIPNWVGKQITDVTSKQAAVVDLQTTHTLTLEASQAMVASVKSQFQKLADALSKMSLLQKESSDLAYLVVSQYSFAAGKAVPQLSAPEAAFCLGADLFDVTQFPSALPSFEASLTMVLKPAKAAKKSVTLLQAISGLQPEFRQALKSDTIAAPKVLPLHFALSKCDEVSGGDTWAPAFEAVTGLKAAHSLTPDELAIQFYLEKMLTSHLEG
jgi:hypothetical protein